MPSVERRSILVLIACVSVMACVVVGTLANGRPLLVTPISLLHGGPAGWFYELILLLMVLVAGLCVMRWRHLLPQHRTLGATLVVSGGLCLLLIGLPFPERRWHETVATLAMASIAAHSVLTGLRFRHPVLPLAGAATTLALLLFLTGSLPLVGVGEHLLLVCAMPGILLCYGAAKPPPTLDDRMCEGRSPLLLLIPALFEKRAVLSGCIWAGIVVTAARLFDAIALGPKTVLSLALPCWIAGAAAPHFAARFPQRFAVHALGAAVGLGLAAWAGGIHSGIMALLLLAFGLPFLASFHWFREELEQRGFG